MAFCSWDNMQDITFPFDAQSISHFNSFICVLLVLLLFHVWNVVSLSSSPYTDALKGARSPYSVNTRLNYTMGVWLIAPFWPFTFNWPMKWTWFHCIQRKAIFISIYQRPLARLLRRPVMQVECEERERKHFTRVLFSLTHTFSWFLASSSFSSSIYCTGHFAYQDTIPWAMKIITLQTVPWFHSTNIHSTLFTWSFFFFLPSNTWPLIRSLQKYFLPVYWCIYFAHQLSRLFLGDFSLSNTWIRQK